MTEPKDDFRETNRDISAETEAFRADFSNSDAMVGQVLDGRFLIQKDLTDTGADAGGFGLVYLARDVKLMAKEVVVKILQKAALQNEEIARKFQHEKEALIRIDHPNVVRILDTGKLSDGNPFLVMEYVEGRSLRRELREKGKLPLDFAAHVVESVTRALHAVHAQKILHRDIKPENIMLSVQDEGFDRVRLIDFGIARVEDSQLAAATTVGQSVGTVRYMAPEQLIGNLEQTRAVDIYSFAIVAYEMLTGELPFNPKSIIEMFELQRSGVMVLPSSLRPDLPPEAERILLKALEFDADNRPKDIRTFGAELAKALRSETSSDPAITFMPDLAKTEPASMESIVTNIRTPDYSDIGAASGSDSQQPNKSKIALIAGAIGAFVLVAVAIPVGILLFSGGGSGTAANGVNGRAANAGPAGSGAEEPRELSYFLNVQKMRDGKPFEAPFRSSGQEVYEDGYAFTMALQTDRDGYMYIMNEGKDAQGNVAFNFLYPTPETNGGSAAVTSGKPATTGENTFTGGRGTEIVWLIWTAQKSPDLEAARASAFRSEGVVKDATALTQLKAFFDKNSTNKPEIIKDSANQRTIIKGKGDVVLHRMELEHR